MHPQGRLTLQANKPVMDGVDISSSCIYYEPYIGNTIPAWTGLAFADAVFSPLTLSLAGLPAEKIYDVLFDGTDLVHSAAWSSLYTRAEAIELRQGVWCAALSNYTYLGSVYLNSTGQTQFQTKPAPVAYGTNNLLGLWNAYNRVPVHAICRDSITTWQYASSGVRYVNNSDRWRIWWLDGLAQSGVCASYRTSVAGLTTGAAAATVAALLDATYPLGFQGGELSQAAMNNSATGMMLEGDNVTPPLLGLHSYQAGEQSTNIAMGFYGNDFSRLAIQLDM